MSLITDLRNLLLADSAVNARVGGTRIYNNRFPQSKTVPTTIENSILITTESDLPVTALDKQYSVRPIFQIMHFAPNHQVSEEMEAETRAVLEGYQGELGSRDDVRILRIDARDDLEPDLNVAMKVAEYQIWL